MEKTAKMATGASSLNPGGRRPSKKEKQRAVYDLPKSMFK